MTTDSAPLVGIVMGSISDWEVMKHAADQLKAFGVPVESRVLSAHRCAHETIEWAETAESRGMEVLIAGAGMAAALPGVVAAASTLPVLGVPLDASLQGMDSLLAIVQMPPGIPVGTLAIGKPGAINAALFAAAILGNNGRPELKEKIREYRKQRKDKILATTLD